MFYKATYQPQKKTGLSAEAKKFIGKTIALQESGIMKQGPYKGQDSYIPAEKFGVVPACDLENITSLTPVQWKDICKSLA